MSRGDLARTCHIAVHLLDQRRGILEAALAPQALQKVQTQLLPVQLAVEVEDVCLDQLTSAGLKCWAHADAHRGRAWAGGGVGGLIRKARIDAVAGTRERLIGN